MNADTISASPASCTSTSHRRSIGQPQRRRVGDGQRVGEADQEEERVDRKRPRRGDLRERRRPEQQQRADDGADGDQPPELPPAGRIAEASVDSTLRQLADHVEDRQYIAMTMPPTTAPRNAIMIGSSSVSRPATAVSTSSS